MKIYNINDASFKKYGKVLKNYKFDELLNLMENFDCGENVIYYPSVEKLENTNDMKILQNEVYGSMPIQIEYCNGHNNKLNALDLITHQICNF